ncbi:hypothetical protein ACFFGV_10345 [Pontibacillus salicampi]|uniref:ABC transporter permease n=1 Tax=Pontibacillus salicampi TaxID=1449801 RepID=A0ABV6LNI6_9BACI
MSGFKGLWKKEWRLTLAFHIFVLLLQLVIIGLTYWRVSSFNENFVLIPMLLILILHIFYLPGFMLVSLGKEARMLHLFLHSPRSIHTIMGAKALNGLLFMVISLTVINGLIVYVLSRTELFTGKVGEIIRLLLWGDVQLIALSLEFSIFLFLLWTIRQLLKSYIGKWSILITILIFIAFPFVTYWLTTQPFYEFMTSWGEVSFGFIDLIQNLDLDIGNFQMEIEAEEDATWYIGEVFVELIFTVLFYWLASYLLDKKVEV